MLFYECHISTSSYVNETSERIFWPAGSVAVAKTLASRGARAPGLERCLLARSGASSPFSGVLEKELHCKNRRPKIFAGYFGNCSPFCPRASTGMNNQQRNSYTIIPKEYV